MQEDPPKPRFGPWLVPGALVAISAVALAAAYSVAYVDPKGPTLEPTQPPRKAPSDVDGIALSANFYPKEGGPDGQAWQWMDDAGALEIRNAGKPRWLAFRALSLARPRRLTVRANDGAARTLRIGPQAQTYVVGPFEFGAKEIMRVQARPGARRPSKQDRRKLSVFVSSIRSVASPVAALIGSGFWMTEKTRDGRPFNWMTDQGHIEIAAGRGQSEAWVGFTVGSADALQREVTLFGGGVQRRVMAPLGAEQRFAVGPFPLRAGRMSVRVTVDPGPRKVPGDGRILGIRLSALNGGRSEAEARREP